MEITSAVHDPWAGSDFRRKYGKILQKRLDYIVWAPYNFAMGAMKRAAIGVDMGGTNVRLGVVGQDGAVIRRARFASDVHGGPHDFIGRLSGVMKELAADCAQNGVEIVAAGLGVPGNILSDAGLVVISPNLPGWRNFNALEAFSGCLPFPVAIDNDANVIALGEKWFGAGRPYQHFLCLTLGTGVGGGLILNGTVWRGSWGSGGEVGHMTIDPRGTVCPCGGRGCLETEASATAIRRKALEFLEGGARSTLTEYLSKPESLTAHEVADAARRGDDLAMGIYRGVGAALGRAMVNVMNLLGLEAFLIGGGVSGAFDLFRPSIMAEIERVSTLFPVETYRVLQTELGEDAGVLGAARQAFDRVGGLS